MSLCTDRDTRYWDSGNWVIWDMAARPDPTRRLYRTRVNREPLEIDVRYKNLRYIGGGAYGFVCSADDEVRLR